MQGGVDTSLIRWDDVRRHRPHRPQRPQLHRARLRRARRGRRLRPGHTADRPARARRRRLGRHVRPTRRALAPHRRHLRRAVRDHCRSSPRRRWPPRRSTARSSPTTSTTAPACGPASAASEIARDVNTRLAGARRRDDRQRGGLHRLARLRRRARRRAPARAADGQLRGDGRHGRGEDAVVQGHRDHAARRPHRQRQRLAGIAWSPETACCSRRRASTSRSTTASAVATGSPPASSTACSSGEPLQTCLEYGAAHGALAMTTPGDTSMATRDEVLRAGRRRERARASLTTRLDESTVIGPPADRPAVCRAYPCTYEN